MKHGTIPAGIVADSVCYTISENDQKTIKLTLSICTIIDYGTVRRFR